MDQTVPLKFMDRLVSTVARNIRRLREREGVSLGALATRSGVGKATLSRLEAGQGNPTVETLYALADALGVTLGDLVTEDSGHLVLMRAADAPRVSGAITARVMDRIHGIGLAEVLTFSVPAGQRRLAAAHAPGTQEHVLATGGRLVTGPADAPVTLAPGDLLAFAADVPHIYEAAGDEEASGVAIVTYPPRR
jgi:transcriptional regulator with XRE-family HTH domain